MSEVNLVGFRLIVYGSWGSDVYYFVKGGLLGFIDIGWIFVFFGIFFFLFCLVRYEIWVYEYILDVEGLMWEEVVVGSDL